MLVQATNNLLAPFAQQGCLTEQVASVAPAPRCAAGPQAAESAEGVTGWPAGALSVLSR